MDDPQIRELARFLAASYLAWQFGYKSIDYVLRTKVPKKLPPHWIAFAKECHGRMNPASKDVTN